MGWKALLVSSCARVGKPCHKACHKNGSMFADSGPKLGNPNSPAAERWELPTLPMCQLVERRLEGMAKTLEGKDAWIENHWVLKTSWG